MDRFGREFLILSVIVGGLFLITRPVTRLGKTQVALTGLVGIICFAQVEAAIWLRSMAHENPVRQLWQPRLTAICNFVGIGSLVGYAGFTFYHLVTKSKTGPR